MQLPQPFLLISTDITPSVRTLIAPRWAGLNLTSLEPRVSVPDFVSQLEDKIWNGKPGFETKILQPMLVLVCILLGEFNFVLLRGEGYGEMMY